MAAKYDGVVEAVRYAADGQIGLVRVYERRGPTWTDRILLTREQFIQRLKSKKKYRAGSRVSHMASTFQVGEPIGIQTSAGGEVIASDSTSAGHDDLGEVPVF